MNIIHRYSFSGKNVEKELDTFFDQFVLVPTGKAGINIVFELLYLCWTLLIDS